MKSSHRPAAVAGLFYPEDESHCRQQVQQLLLQSGQRPIEPLQALIAPHAGFIYSGPVAATAFRAIPQSWEGRTIAIFGPNHRAPLQGMALDDHRFFSTPLGNVPVDIAALTTLGALADIAINNTAHAEEHCIEVQLPFLQCILGEFFLLPVLVGRCSTGVVVQAMEMLLEEGICILVSSDLSHYLGYDAAQERDANTSTAITALKANLRGEEACGSAAINGLNTLAIQHNWQATTLAMNNSGDTAGDKQGVVGYGAYAYR